MLLIEDDKREGQEITAELADRGFEVEWCEWHRVPQGAVLVAASDRSTGSSPGMDGLTVIEALRRNRCAPRCWC